MAMAHRDIHRGGAEPEQRVMPHVATVADHDLTSDVLDDSCESRMTVSASGTIGRITRLHGDRSRPIYVGDPRSNGTTKTNRG
jgi:hypothetical protein